MFSYELLHMDTSVLADQKKKLTCTSYVDTGYRLEDLPNVMADRNR